MTHPSHQAVPAGQRRSSRSQRSTWLQTSIVSASVVATLAGTQGIAWLESRNALADIAAAAPLTTAEAAFVYPGATGSAPAAAVEQTTGAQTGEISLLALLPTPTPATTLSAAASAPVNPTDTPVPTPTVAPTPEPTATPTAAIVSAPAQSQAGSAARPLARSRSSR